MDAQQANSPLAAQGNKKRSKRRLVFVAVIIVALIVATISTFSTLGTIPGIWATVISTQ